MQVVKQLQGPLTLPAVMRAALVQKTDRELTAMAGLTGTRPDVLITDGLDDPPGPFTHTGETAANNLALKIALARVTGLEAELAALRIKTFNGTATEGLAAVLLAVGKEVCISPENLMEARSAVVEVSQDHGSFGYRVVARRGR